MDNGHLIDEGPRLASAVVNLNVALRNLGLYGDGHPMSGSWTRRAAEELGELLARRPRIVLKMLEGDLVFEGNRLLEDTAPVRGLIEAFSARRVESVTFLPGLEEDELAAFLELLRQEPQALEQAGGIAEGARSQGLSHILVEDLHYLVEGGTGSIAGKGGDETGGADLVAREVYLSALSVVRDTVVDARAGRPIEADKVANLARSIVDQVLQNEAGMTALTSIKTYDEYTFQHCVNLTILCLAVGSRTGLKADQLTVLGLCALLHDTGKVFVPMEILRKPGKMTQEEWALMERHPVDGARLLAGQPGLPPLAPVVAFEHHLKNDLSGYPRRSRREALNLFTLAVALADCYDALTTPRPYREPLLPQQAVGVMQEGRGKDFEPRLLNYFVDMLGPYPVGSCVRLDDGSVALVARTDSRPPFDLWLLPLLTLTGEAVSGAEQIRLSAQEVFGPQDGKNIRETVNPASCGLDIERILAEVHRLPR